MIAVNEMDSKTMNPENSARYPAGYVSPHSAFYAARPARRTISTTLAFSSLSSLSSHPILCRHYVVTLSLILITLAFSSLWSPSSPPTLCQRRVVTLDNLGILVTQVTQVTLVTLVTASIRSKHSIGAVVTMIASLPLRSVSMGCNGASCVWQPDHSKLSCP